MEKQLEFAHPTSTTATKLGHGKTGTWFVCDKTGINDAKTRNPIAFRTWAEANAHIGAQPRHHFSQQKPLNDKPIW